MPVLGYWSVRAFGQPLRTLLHYVGEEFEDRRYTYGPAPDFSRDEWLKEKYTLGLQLPNLPYYIDGETKITQSTAILRHLGRKHNLMPTTEAEHQQFDQILDEVKDVWMILIRLCFNPDFENIKAQYSEMMKNKLKGLNPSMDNRTFVLGDKITVCDFIMYEVVHQIKVFDTTLVDECKHLTDFYHRMRDLPAIKKYESSEDCIQRPIFSPPAQWQ